VVASASLTAPVPPKRQSIGRSTAGSILWWIPAAAVEAAWLCASCTKPRGFGWRIHCGVEVTESSTNKQHTHSLKSVLEPKASRQAFPESPWLVCGGQVQYEHCTRRRDVGAAGAVGGVVEGVILVVDGRTTHSYLSIFGIFTWAPTGDEEERGARKITPEFMSFETTSMSPHTVKGLKNPVFSTSLTSVTLAS